ncbi:MAG: FecR domain-containing protein [Planctomycetes bacterium]|nr:FecR domain-containing protein [Planctomycetota bacterium]
MSEPSQDEERELTLSLYIDGELDAARRQEVEEKLRSDPAWKAEYEALTDSDKRVSKVVQDSWHDPEFTGRVMDRITKQNLPPAPEWAGSPSFTKPLPPTSSASPLRDKRMRLLVSLAAAASLSLFGVTLWFLFGNRRPVSNPLPQVLASADPESVRLEMDLSRFSGYVAGNVYLGQTVTVKAETACVKWSDGTRLWLRQDAKVRALGARSLEVDKGVFLIDVARGTQPFILKLADESQIQVLGTRFEVEAKETSTRIRVLEGHVRRSGGKAVTGVDARGGEEITADLQVRAIDPREILISWADLAATPKAAAIGLPSAFAAPWPQLGGTPGHAGVTPLAGPAGLAATRFIPFPAAGGGAAEESTQYAPAVVGAGSRVFVLRRAGTGKMQLYGLDLEDKGDAAWKPCGEPLPGNAQNPPVITARGLVVAGASGNIVQAWDPDKGAVAWKKDVESSVYALCAAYDGNVYCSTYQRMIVLDGNGEKAWAYPNIKDVQAPVSIAPDGTALVMARDGKSALLDRDGKLIEMLNWEAAAAEQIFWPPVLAVRALAGRRRPADPGRYRGAREGRQPPALRRGQEHALPPERGRRQA